MSGKVAAVKRGGSVPRKAGCQDFLLDSSADYTNDSLDAMEVLPITLEGWPVGPSAGQEITRTSQVGSGSRKTLCVVEPKADGRREQQLRNCNPSPAQGLR